MCNECLMNGHITHRCTKVFNLDAHERNDLTVLLTKARQKFGVFDEVRIASSNPVFIILSRSWILFP